MGVHSGIFDEKLSREQKIQSVKKVENVFHPNLTKLGYPLGIYLRRNQAKKFLNPTRGSGDMGVRRIRNESVKNLRAV